MNTHHGLPSLTPQEPTHAAGMPREGATPHEGPPGTVRRALQWGCKTAVGLALCLGLAGTAAAVPRPSSATPGVVTLSKHLFITIEANLFKDQDGDFQDDSMEAELAEQIKPFLHFSQYEDARQPHEPQTLFQVIPRGCTGLDCPVIPGAGATPSHRYRVRVVFWGMFDYDSGYGGSEGSGFCGLDNHDWDNTTARMEIVSMDGIDWTFVLYSLSEDWIWPDGPRQDGARWVDGTHPVMYLSAGKHHNAFDARYNDEDSLSSAWWCNDLIDDQGDSFYPSLVSPYPDRRPSNVGAFESHSSVWFINSLAPYGYPDRDAWGTQAETWEKDPPATFTGHFFTHGTIAGQVTLPGGANPSQVKVYFRPSPLVDGLWDAVSVDASGHFSIHVPATETGTVYLLRPVASDFDFLKRTGVLNGIPKPVVAKLGQTTSTAFTGQYPPSQLVLAEPVPPSIPSNQYSLKAYMSGALSVNHSSSPFPALSALNSTADTTGVDEWTGLPFRQTLTFTLRSVLDSDSQEPAASVDDAPCLLTLEKVVCSYWGPGVSGATLEVWVRHGSGVVNGSGAPIQVTTNALGEAKVRLIAGTHPGEIQVQARVVDNPVNPWLTAWAPVYRVVAQPDTTHDDRFNGASTARPTVAVIPYIPDTSFPGAVIPHNPSVSFPGSSLPGPGR